MRVEPHRAISQRHDFHEITQLSNRANLGNGLNGPSVKTVWSSGSLCLASGPYCPGVEEKLRVLIPGQI